MKRLFIISSCLALAILLRPSLGHAQITSVKWTITPTVTTEVGQPFAIVFKVTDTANAPVSGFVSIEKFIKTTDLSETKPTASQTPITAAGNGTNTILFALGQTGTYTIDLCFQETTTSACIIGTSVATILIVNPPGGSSPAGSSPAATPPTPVSNEIVKLPNPIACNDATCLISQIIRYILGSIAVIATLMFIWGGIMMLTSAGNADQVKRAKETLTWAAIGVIVILLSWIIIKTVLQALTKTTS